MTQLPDMIKVAQELKEHEGLKISLDPSDAFSIVAQLQLALRHPDNTGVSTEVILSFINAIINIGFAYCPEVQKVLRMGLYEHCDLTDDKFDHLYLDNPLCENQPPIATQSVPATPTTSSMTSESSTVTIWSVSTPKPNIT